MLHLLVKISKKSDFIFYLHENFKREKWNIFEYCSYFHTNITYYCQIDQKEYFISCT